MIDVEDDDVEDLGMIPFEWLRLGDFRRTFQESSNLKGRQNFPLETRPTFLAALDPIR